VFTEERDAANLELDQQDRVLVDVRDYATWDVFSPKKKINTAAGGILGLLLGTIIVFALEYVEAGVFRSAEDVERYAGLPVLSAIPPSPTSDSTVAPSPIRRWQQRWLGG
jgi:capsular polysaccharide biosynthesis protein